MKDRIYVYNKTQIMHYDIQDTRIQQYEVKLYDLNIDQSIDIELWEDGWALVSDAQIQVLKVQKVGDKFKYVATASQILMDDVICYCKVIATGELLQVLKQNIDDKDIVYVKYRLPIQENYKLKVGSGADVNIRYRNSLLKEVHCILENRNGEMYLQANGNVWLNGKRVTAVQKITETDIISIYDLKIVYLPQMLAINSIVDAVQLHTVNALDTIVDIEDSTVDYSYFLRMPRQMEIVNTDRILIEAPPSRKQEDKTPWLLSIGPSFTMMLPMVASMLINMTLNNQSGRSIVSYIGIGATMIMSALIATGWGIGRRIYQKKQVQKYEKIRKERYTAYITETEEQITEKESENVRILTEQYKRSQEYIKALLNCNETCLWNRNINHTDYGFIRIGTGKQPNYIQVENATKKKGVNLDEETDTLEIQATEIIQGHKYVPEIPIIYNILQEHVVGVIGTKEYMYSFARALIVQLSYLYSYTDVQIAIINTVKEQMEMNWSRYIPHIMSKDGLYRLYAYDEESTERLIGIIVKILKERQAEIENKQDVAYTKLVVFCFNKKIIESDAIRQYVNNTQNLGVIFILMFGSMALLPNGCKRIIENDNYYTGVYTLDAPPDKESTIKYESVDVASATLYARELCKYVVQEAVDGQLPTSVDLYSILGINKIEQWNLPQAYLKSDTSKSIKGLLGVGHNNKIMWLDLHEKQQGPHGLVAGMTGAGKSEMLQTLILTLAMQYSPSELAFVLIDYKGGGMANVFQDLPHVAGVITNIADDMEENEGDNESSTVAQTVQTSRALTSIKAEVKRRLSVFKRYSVNHIDQYTQMYKKGIVKEAMPHLLIIVDEFAELRKEQHSFISDLVSTARVGRSLGVHLILATQKPAGVVDDEIWSNSRFRACLRVQDKQDSMGMLHRPEAAYLTQIGRMYLQVGTDEIFEEIQCAYTGAEYIPTTGKSTTENVKCELVNLDGTVVVAKAQRKRTGEKKTQLDVSIKYIQQECQRNNIQATSKLWMPVLPKQLGLDQIVKHQQINTENLNVVIGLIDDVVGQQQRLYMLSLLDITNLMIVGIAGSGKTTMLQTMLYTVSTQYTAEDVQYYIYAYSSSILNVYAQMPQCGDIITDPYTNTEKAKRLIPMMSSLITQRRKLFEQAGVSNIIEYRKIKKLPVVVVIIDNYALWAQVHEDLVADLLVLMRDGPKYGIQFIITVAGVNEVKYNMRAYIQQKITLVLPDKAAYRELLGSTPETLPLNIKGRGLLSLGGILMEYQTAVAHADGTELQRNTKIKEHLKIVKEQVLTKSKVHANKIPQLPKDLSYVQICEKNKFIKDAYAKKIFVGYNITTLKPEFIDLMQQYIHIVSDFTTNAQGIKKMLNAYMWNGSRHGYKQFVLNPNGIIEMEKQTDVTYYDGDYISMFDGFKQINDIFVQRVKEYNSMKDTQNITKVQYAQEKEPIILYITNITALLEQYATAECKAYGVKNGLQTDIATMFTGLFTKGAGYGVNVIVGCTREAHQQYVHSDSCVQALFKTNSYIHFGGDLDNVKLFTCTAPASTIPLKDRYERYDDITTVTTQQNGKIEKLWIA